MSDLIPSSQKYKGLLELLHNQIRTAQFRAAVAVTRELLLYLGIGREILLRQKQERWGSKVIDRLAHDLHLFFHRCAGSRPATSNTCGPWPKPSPTKQLCKSRLHIDLVPQPDPIGESEPGRRAGLVCASSNSERLESERPRDADRKADCFKPQGKAITNFQATLSKSQVRSRLADHQRPVQFRLPHTPGGVSRTRPRNVTSKGDPVVVPVRVTREWAGFGFPHRGHSLRNLRAVSAIS